MKSMSRVWKSLSLSGACFMALILTGCASYRIHTTLAPTGKPLPPGAARFNLTEVRYVVPTNGTETGLSPFSRYSIPGTSLRADLMAQAVVAYPDVFSSAPDAIPLQVIITCVRNETEAGASACVSCLTLTLLPLRTRDADTYAVVTQCGIEPIDQALLRPVTFQRTDVSWLSVFPTGWLPVPAGEGDRVVGMDGAIEKVKDVTLKACVEAVVIHLRRIPPESWPVATAGSVDARPAASPNSPAPAAESGTPGRQPK